MASPTETQVQTILKYVCTLYKSVITYAATSGTPTSFVAQQDTLFSLGTPTDFDLDLQAAINSTRAQIDAAIQGSADALGPVMRAYGKVAKFPETDTASLLVDLYQWFVAIYPGSVTPQTITSRQFSYGTSSAIFATGTGAIYRVTKDPYGYDLEACWTQRTTAQVTQDANMGTPRGEERFVFRADAPARDELIRLGSGTVDLQNFRGMSARDSLLLNCSFETCTPIPTQGGSATPTANPTGWCLDVLASFQLTQDQFYRDYLGTVVGSTTNPPVALRFSTNAVATQPFSARNVPLQPLRPYLIQVPIYRESSADGTLTMSLGPLAPFTPPTTCTAALVATGTGNLTNGTYSYKVAFVGPYGESIMSSVSNTVTVDGTHKQVTLTSIPLGIGQNITGGQSVIQRKIYRCASGNAVGGPWLLLTTLKDNFTTTYTDNIADGSLGAAGLTSIVTTRSVSVSISSLTNDTWTLLQFPNDDGSYYKSWQADGLALTLSYTARTTGSIVVDEVGVWPFQPFAGSWAICVGGRTPWRYNDRYSWTDSALGSVIQEILWRGFGRYLPAVPAPVPTSPALTAADGAAGSVDAGTHIWAVTFVGNKGATDTTAAACKQESLPGANRTYATAGSKRVDLTGIPIGGTGITARRVYRTTAGGSTLKFVAEIADNSTTTYTDNTTDAALGYTAPTGATVTDTYP